MAAPSATVWPLAPHTRAKHAILRRYLQAWQLILTRGGFPEIAYIDGFAGPGRYAGGEDGSPIIALKPAISLYESRPEMPRVLFLFHGTNSLTGLKKMKEAMWQVDKSGEFTFSDATDHDQLVLFEHEPRFDVLRETILRRFVGKIATVADVEEFVLAETAFRETHYKRVLKELERIAPARVEAVQPSPGRRAGTYPDPGMRLRFV